MSAVRSFFNHYGILSVPIVSMTIFGHFGLRPSQSKYKLLVYFLNALFLGSFIIFCVGTFGQFLAISKFGPPGVKKVGHIFLSVFTVIIFIVFFMWGVVSYRKYNIFCLLDEVIHIRSNGLSKKDLMCITTAYCIFSVFFLRDIVRVIMLIVSSNRNVQETLDVYIIVLLTIRVTAYFNMVLLWNISVLISLVNLIIMRCKLFHETVERFRQLTLVVNKVDEMFPVFVGILLASTFSLICGTTYHVVEKESFEMWDSVLVFSTLIFAALLSSLATLNYRVRERNKLDQFLGF